MYDQVLCARDAGYMVDSVCFDLLHGGNRQAIQSGVYYYTFDGSDSAIKNEIPQTTFAYSTLTQIVSQLVLNQPVTVTQTKVTQNTSLPVAGAQDASDLTTYLNEILDIINNGPTGKTKAPISLTKNARTSTNNAWAILEANKLFIQEEVIARINSQYFRQYSYNRDKCYRDTGLIVDAIVQDLLFDDTSQSTFAGLQYWNQSLRTGQITNQLTTTTNAIIYARDLCKKIVTGDTIVPLSTGTYRTMPSATVAEAVLVGSKFDKIKDILTSGVVGITDTIIPNGITPTFNNEIRQAYASLQANKVFVQQEVVTYINNNNPGFVYDVTLCLRDVGHMIDSVSFDMLYGGNKQSIQAGVYYWGYSSSSSAIYGQSTGTIDAFNFMYSIIPNIVAGIPVTRLQKNEEQIFDMTGDSAAAIAAQNKINIITNIISNGPAGIAKNPIKQISNTSTNVINAVQIIHANRQFIQAEVVEWVNQNRAFDYNREKCRRDAGLIVDAVSQDLILGGTTKAIEAGVSYWLGTKSYIDGQIPQTVGAVTRAKTIALDIIQNIAVTPTTGNGSKQIINTYFSGGQYATAAVSRTFDIIIDIMTYGPTAAPEQYVGSGLFGATGISNNDTRYAPRVTSVDPVVGQPGQFTIGIDTPTVGVASNATLYFGKTGVYPKLDGDFTTQEAKDWAQRMIDPNGSMGGSLVDGSVVSDRSPINSFVYDAFTQVNQGGRGIHIINNGYAQLVSVFTIFCSTSVEVGNGGIASITNSNANFGDYCLVAKGKGKLDFQGTVYNPAYPTLAQTGGSTSNGQFYPNGYWPQNAQMLAFIPDDVYRPHIGLVMEVVPPDTILTDTTGQGTFVETPYTNDQGLPGFLNAIPNMATLTTGTIKITGIVTDGIAIGNNIHIRDQFGSFTDSAGTRYAATGTTVIDVGFESITLSVALTSGGGEIDNPNFFSMLFCGNAYYNVLSSSLAPNPVAVGSSMLPDGAPHSTAEINALTYMLILTQNVVANTTPISSYPLYPYNTTVSQDKSNGSGSAANAFINDRFNDIIGILTGGVSSAPATRKKGTPPPQASQAIVQLRANKKFIIAEVTAYVAYQITYNGAYQMTDTQIYKCKRDVGIIIDRMILDLTNGGNYNSVMSGLSYFSRAGTYHIISLEDQVRNPLLFPDGASINFYQRSYMSALGYTFEYVGAGTNYGALPQVGRADPIQSREVVQIDNGKVFFTSTDQNGDFRIGPGLVISQATGVLSGRTFTKSLFAQMTPFILAVEAGG